MFLDLRCEQLLKTTKASWVSPKHHHGNTGKRRERSLGLENNYSQGCTNKSQFWQEVFNIDFSGWCVTFLIRIDKSIYVKNTRAKLSSIRIIFFSDDDKQKHWATQNTQTQQTNIMYWNCWEKLSGKKSLTRAKVKTSVKPAWAISCLSRSQSVFNLNCKRSNKTFGAAVVNHPRFSALWSKWLQRLWL